MNGRCYKCNRVLTTGDFDGMCGNCRKQQQDYKPDTNIYFYVIYGKDPKIHRMTLQEIAKLLKPYLDNIENCEVKK